MRRLAATTAATFIICLLIFLRAPTQLSAPEQQRVSQAGRLPAFLVKGTQAPFLSVTFDAPRPGDASSSHHQEGAPIDSFVRESAAQNEQIILEQLNIGENIFWTREQRAEELRHDPEGLKLLGDAIKRPLKSGEICPQDWYGQRLEALHLLEILGRGPRSQGPPSEVADLLETLVVGHRDHGDDKLTVRLAVSLRREAMSSLARVDPDRAIELYRQLPDGRQRQFFAHFLLLGLADGGRAPGSAAALIRDIDDAFAADEAPDRR